MKRRCTSSGEFLAIGLLSCLPVLCFCPLVEAGPISINENQKINFGYTYLGAKNCEVSFAGNLSGDCLGVGSAATVTVNGDPNSSLTVYVTTAGWVGNLKVTPEVPKKYAYVTNNQGVMSFPVAAKLQFRSAAGGVYTLQYSITVNYQ